MSSRLMKHALHSLMILGLLSILLGLSVVAAQDASSRVLTPGAVLNGTLDTANPVQVYTFSGTAEQSVSFTVSNDDEVALNLLVTDATGAPLPAANADNAESTGGSLTNSYTLPADGTYYVIVSSVDSLVDTLSLLRCRQQLLLLERARHLPNLSIC